MEDDDLFLDEPLFDAYDENFGGETRVNYENNSNPIDKNEEEEEEELKEEDEDEENEYSDNEEHLVEKETDQELPPNDLDDFLFGSDMLLGVPEAEGNNSCGPSSSSVTQNEGKDDKEVFELSNDEEVNLLDQNLENEFFDPIIPNESSSSASELKHDPNELFVSKLKQKYKEKNWNSHQKESIFSVDPLLLDDLSLSAIPETQKDEEMQETQQLPPLPLPLVLFDFKKLSSKIEKPQIQNMVSTSILNCELNLKEVVCNFKTSDYNQRTFAAAKVMLDEPKTTILVFKNGKLVCAGAKNHIDSDFAIKKCACIIANIEKDKKIKYNGSTIQNIVGSCNLGFKICLYKVQEHIKNSMCEYNPDSFPGLIYHLDYPKITLLLFSSGKAVMTGMKKIEDMERGFEHILEILYHSGQIPYRLLVD